MEKYEAHGLTRMEDDILRSFGSTEDREELKLESFASEYRKAFSNLVRKGLLDRKHDEYENVAYVLTPKGRRLWEVRSKEEGMK